MGKTLLFRASGFAVLKPKFPADPAKQDALCSVKIQDIIAVLLTHMPHSLMGKMGLILVPTKAPYKRLP